MKKQRPGPPADAQAPAPSRQPGRDGRGTDGPPVRSSAIFYTHCNGAAHLAEAMQIFLRQPSPLWKLLVLHRIFHFS